ncbi:hypothetical protein IK110_03625 [Candidatus Saccharibacteria bacterium]|nr:hypothetical protein [Candidatus Saccharibacteria bacterium]
MNSLEKMDSRKNDTENLHNVDPETLKLAKRILENTVNDRNSDMTDEFREEAKKLISWYDGLENNKANS